MIGRRTAQMIGVTKTPRLAPRLEIALDGGRGITVFADVDGGALRRVLGIVERR